MIHFLAYLLVYVLFCLAIDLLREVFDPHGMNRRYGAIKRRPWNDSAFDCRSLVFTIEPPAKRGNRVRLLP